MEGGKGVKIERELESLPMRMQQRDPGRWWEWRLQGRESEWDKKEASSCWALWVSLLTEGYIGFP